MGTVALRSKNRLATPRWEVFRFGSPAEEGLKEGVDGTISIRFENWIPEVLNMQSD